MRTAPLGKPAFFDVLLAALGDPDQAARAVELLARRLPDGPGAQATPTIWHAYVTENRTFLFFLQEGGYQWHLDPLAKARSVPCTELRGPLRATARAKPAAAAGRRPAPASAAAPCVHAHAVCPRRHLGAAGQSTPQCRSLDRTAPAGEPVSGLHWGMVVAAGWRPPSPPNLDTRSAHAPTSASWSAQPRDCAGRSCPAPTAVLCPRASGLVFAPGFVLAGAPGVAGAGTMQLPLPLPAGLTLFLQAVVLDAAGPIGLVHSNGVELTIGQ